MEILPGVHSHSPEPTNDDVVAVPDPELVQSLQARIQSKVWEERSGAFEYLLSSANKIDLFDLIDTKPAVFISEQTPRGQELALKCILEWTRGLVGFSGSVELKFMESVILSYGHVCHEKVRSILLSIFDVISDRFGTAKVLSTLSKTLLDASKEALVPKSKDASGKPLSKGLISRQLIGCMQLASLLSDRYKEDMTTESLIPRVAEVVTLTSNDRALRDECYSFLETLLRRNPTISIDSLHVPPAQSKELKARMTGPSPSPRGYPLLSEKPDCVRDSLSTSASPRPSDQGVLRELTTAERSVKWQDRRAAWCNIRSTIQANPREIPDDVWTLIIKTLKSELNVPITLEVCGTISDSPLTNLNPGMGRQILSSLTCRLREKSTPVQRALTEAIIHLVASIPTILDLRWVEVDLKPIISINPRQIVDLTVKTLQHMNYALELSVLKYVSVPCMCDMTVRDSAVMLTKRILAQAATSDQDSHLSHCLSELRQGLSSLSAPRRRILEAALGVPIDEPVVNISSRSMARPKSACISSSKGSSCLGSVRRSVSAIPKSARLGDKLHVELRDPLPDRNSAVSFKPDAMSVRRLSSHFRSALVASIDSERLRQYMFDQKKVSNACRALSAWTDFSKSISTVLGVTDLLVRWIVVIDSVFDQRVLEPMLGLLESIADGLHETELRIAVPLLKKRYESASPSLRSRIMALMDRWKVDSKILAGRSSSAEIGELKTSRGVCFDNWTGTAIASECNKLMNLIDHGDLHAGKAAIETLSKNLSKVLVSGEPEPRQTILSLLHKVSRDPRMWSSVPGGVLRSFLQELLTLVNDKNFRAREPETWAEINLSAVHAIANSDRCIAYGALLRLRSEGTTLQNLVIRCIEKLNRSLSDFLVNDKNMASLLTVLHSYIESLLMAGGEAAVVGNECVMICLQGVCEASSLVEVGEFIGLHVKTPQERLVWKKLLKIYSATEKRRKSITD
jgi:hypothetical protein